MSDARTAIAKALRALDALDPDNAAGRAARYGPIVGDLVSKTFYEPAHQGDFCMLAKARAEQLVAQGRAHTLDAGEALAWSEDGGVLYQAHEAAPPEPAHKAEAIAKANMEDAGVLLSAELDKMIEHNAGDVAKMTRREADIALCAATDRIMKTDRGRKLYDLAYSLSGKRLDQLPAGTASAVRKFLGR